MNKIFLLNPCLAAEKQHSGVPVRDPGVPRDAFCAKTLSLDIRSLFSQHSQLTKTIGNSAQRSQLFPPSPRLKKHEIFCFKSC